MSQRGEQRLVQAFAAQLAGGGVMPFCVALVRPTQVRHAGQLGSIVADVHAWLAALADDGGRCASDPGTRERRIGH